MTLPPYAMNQSSFPEMYERWLVGPLFQPWAELLLERARLQEKDRVLDVACGTGIVARLAKKQLGNRARVTGVDLSQPMLAVAKSIDPGIDWRPGNAAALPFGDEEKFDVVFCQQGLQFVPEKAAAMNEMRRVLTPRGRVFIATWCSIDESPFLSELHRIAERHLGNVVDQRHSFGDSGALEKLLQDAGFRDVVVEALSLPIRFADGGAFLHLNTMAIVGMSAPGKNMSEEERAQVVDRIVEGSRAVAKRYTQGEALVYDIRSNVATARA